MSFLAIEKRTLLACGGLYAVRLFGLFMILPVLTLLAASYGGATSSNIGWTLGIYGATQAIFQFPLGWLSDKFGRQRVLYGAFALLCLGSLIGCFAHSIWGLMLARALQGAGAIGSVVLAALSDRVRESVRPQAMALVGASIGVSFMLAMVMGPLVSASVGLSGLFWVMMGLGLLGMVLVKFILPKQTVEKEKRQTEKKYFKFSSLIPCCFGIAVLHASLSALFLMIPTKCVDLGLSLRQTGWLYAGVLLIAALLVWPLLKKLRDPDFENKLILTAISGLVVVHILFWQIGFQSLVLLVNLLVIYFVFFCLLESYLPSKVSGLVPAHVRGKALGLYSTCQFIGIFIGASGGGRLLSQGGSKAVLTCLIPLFVMWFMIVYVDKSSIFKRGVFHGKRR